jgi:hypothetical protein
MTANQYRAMLSRLGLSQAGAARLLQIGERTARRWAQEGVEGTAVIVLRLLAAKKITQEDVESVHEH